MLQGLTLGTPRGWRSALQERQACAASPAPVPHPPYTPCPGAPERDSWASWALGVRERASRSAPAGTVRGGLGGRGGSQNRIELGSEP